VPYRSAFFSWIVLRLSFLRPLFPSLCEPPQLPAIVLRDWGSLLTVSLLVTEFLPVQLPAQLRIHDLQFG
jgi:hypothetical protein